MSMLIFANGEIDGVDWMGAWIKGASTVIAADGGARHAIAAGLQPDVLIGDLDSVNPAQRAALAEAGVRFIVRPVDKDETDLELALLHAVDSNGEDVVVFGAFGGRTDQSLANILLLAHPRLRGRPIRLVDRHQQLWLIDGATTIAGEIGDTVSLIPIGGDAQVARTDGLRWPLVDDRLPFGVSRGVSNLMTAPTARVEVKDGLLICLHTSRDWFR
jgi:thiamine pyrophosphokinase